MKKPLPSMQSDGSLALSDLLKLPFKGGGMAEVKGLVTPKNLARGLLGGAGAYAASAALNPLIEAACIRGMGGSMQMSESGAFEECVPGTGPDAPPTPQSDGFQYTATEWQSAGSWWPTREQACAYGRSRYNAGATTVRYDPIGSGVVFQAGGYRCTARLVNTATGGTVIADASYPQILRRASTCAAGWYITSGGCQQIEPVQDVEWRDVSRTDAENKLEDAIKDVANVSKVIAAIRDYLDKQGSLEFDAPTVTGPASSQGEPTTTTTTTDTGSGPQTLTTTTTVTNNYTYNNSTVNVTTTTSSTTRNEAGDVVSSTTTQGEPEADDSPPIDTPLPPVPDLYVRKYPDGMLGIWNQYKEQIKASSLATAVSDLLPANIGDGGTCPSWPLNLSMASWADFGTHDVAPPCWIWGVAKAILILSALLLARALIFGG